MAECGPEEEFLPTGNGRWKERKMEGQPLRGKAPAPKGNLARAALCTA